MKVADRRLIATLAFGFCAATLTAYEPVVVAGLRGYASYGSADSLSTVVAFGPEVDADVRALIGEQLYVAGWYNGTLRFEPNVALPRDHSSLGALIGGSVASVGVRLELGAEASSTLGDGQALFAPDWSVSISAPIGPRTGVETSYTGFYHHEPAGTQSRLGNGADAEIRWDPSLQLGLAAGAGASATSFRDRFILDASGAATNVLRHDRAAQIRFGAEGLIGYFSFWEAEASGGIVRSNDTSEERDLLGIDLIVSADPSSVLGLRASASTTGSWYVARTALDADGAPIGDLARALRVTTTLNTQWNVLPDLFIVAGFSGVFGSSNDAALSGWSAEGSMGVQVRL